jgi:hypothetical protein
VAFCADVGKEYCFITQNKTDLVYRCYAFTCKSKKVSQQIADATALACQRVFRTLALLRSRVKSLAEANAEVHLSRVAAVDPDLARTEELVELINFEGYGISVFWGVEWGRWGRHIAGILLIISSRAFPRWVPTATMQVRRRRREVSNGHAGDGRGSRRRHTIPDAAGVWPRQPQQAHTAQSVRPQRIRTNAILAPDATMPPCRHLASQQTTPAPATIRASFTGAVSVGRNRLPSTLDYRHDPRRVTRPIRIPFIVHRDQHRTLDTHTPSVSRFLQATLC